MGYLRDRLLQAIITLWAIVTLAFFLNKSMPGGPIDFLQRDIRQNPNQYGLPPNPTQEQVNQVINRLVDIPPDVPMHIAYIDYLHSIVIEQSFGTSIVIAANVPVMDLIAARAPWTIFISLVALLYGVLVGVFLGSLMAYFEGTKFDIGLTIAMTLDRSVPYYIAAIFLLFVFAFQLGWFPTGGRANPDAAAGLNWPWLASVFNHAFLPAMSFIIVGFGGRALGLRANAIRLIGSDYVRNAQLRGLSTYRVATTYLARNAILPMYTSIVVGLGVLIGGSVIMEFIFQYPGMGLLLFDAAVQRDFPVLMGTFVITTVIFVIGTIIADFTYPLIDPRADVTASRE